MGVDFFPCANCDETICDCGEFYTCEDCGRHYCCWKCTGMSDEELESYDGYHRCRFCTALDATTEQLLEHALWMLKTDRESLKANFLEKKARILKGE